MKLLAIHFDDDEEPERVAVELSHDELAVLARLTGCIAPLSITTATGDNRRWGDALAEAADGLNDVMIRLHDDGTNSVIPRLNPPPYMPRTTDEHP